MHIHSSRCGCVDKRIHTHAGLRRDPTRTVMIRRRYEADLVGRFKALRKAIKALVGTQNGFGLQANREVFEFPKSADKVDAFMRWLEDQEYRGILEVTRGTSLKSSAQGAWQNVYIRSAYQKAIAQAAGLMQRDGVQVEQTWIDGGMFRPIHADSIGLIYTRAYSDLEGITDAMDQHISRTLAQGLAEGRGAMEIADDLAERVDAIGIARARMLARTEIIGAYADATLNSYEEAGLEGVELLEEFATAVDNVCLICEGLAKAGPYTITEARGKIPVHPNCRCAWLPIVQSPKGIVLR